MTDVLIADPALHGAPPADRRPRPSRIRGRRATIAVVAVMALVGVVHLLLPGGLEHGIRTWSVGPGTLERPDQLWRLLLAPVTAAPTAGWVLALVATAVILGVAEPRLGSLRTAGVWLASGLIGSVAGLAGVDLGEALHESASIAVRSAVFPDVSPGLLGVLLAASTRDRSGRLGWLPAPVLTIAVAVLLYTGDPHDIGRLVGAGVGIALGIAAGGRLPRPAMRRGVHARTRRALALATLAMAAGPLLVFFGPRRPGLLSMLGELFVAQPDWTPATLASGLGALNVGVVVLTIVAAHGMLRGTRAAALLAVVLDVGIGAVGLLGYVVPAVLDRWFAWKALADVEFDVALLAVAVVPLGLAALILIRLRHFSVRMPRGRGRSALLALLAVVLGGLAAYLLGSLAFGADLGRIIAGAPSRFLPPGVLNAVALDDETLDPVVRAVGRWCGVLVWGGGILIAQWAVLAVGRGRERHGASSRLRAQLHRHGGGSLGQMAMWPGFRVWHDADRTVAVSYRLVGRVAIALAQPIGPAVQEAGAIAEFARWCDDRGWSPAFYSAPERLRPVFEAIGWRTVSVGTEAVVRLEGFDLGGKRKQNVRTAVNRARREGLEALWTSAAELGPELRAEVRRVSDAWVASRSLPEMGFTLGGIEQLADPDVRLMLAVDPAGRVHAVTSWLPVHEEGGLVGYTLDVMRRDGAAMPGAIEFLIAETAFRSRGAGLRALSLSVAPLAPPPGTGRAGDRWIARIGRVLEPLYGFRSLAAFKARFEPDDLPVLLAFPGDAALGPTAVAVLRSYLPGLSVGIAVRGLRTLLSRRHASR